MAETPASFSELTGVGPLTEARLHEAGVQSWPALATVLTALDGVRSTGRDPLRRLSRQVAERASECPSADDGERSEAFIVRMALDDTGHPLRTRVTHVRTSAEHLWSGWAPDEAVRFVEDCAGLWTSFPVTGDAGASTSEDAGDEVGDDHDEGPGVRDHIVDVDAGRILGGTRNADLRLTVVTGVAQDLQLDAELSARAYGTDGRSPWTALAHRRENVDPNGVVALPFGDVVLPQGLYRLRLRVTIHLPEPSRVPPEIILH